MFNKEDQVCSEIKELEYTVYWTVRSLYLSNNTHSRFWVNLVGKIQKRSEIYNSIIQRGVV